MKKAFISFALITCALLSGCAAPKEPPASHAALASPSPAMTVREATQTPQPTPEPTPEPTIPPAPPVLSTWIAYWDESDYLAELYVLQPDNISLFGAMFKKDGGLYLADNTKEVCEAILASDYKAERLFLTFVNDVEIGHRKYLQKDTDILWTVLADDESVQTHIDEIIELTKSMGADGVEIDYEAINSDQELWERLLAFLEKLYARCADEELALRVLLEPNALDQGLTFPPGPKYEIMCYNLYGAHSGAGPKASIDFILKLIEKSEALPGEVSLAFANGGFMWADGVPKGLRESEIEHFAKEYNVEKIRDEASGAVCFYYTDPKGRSTAIWYADDVTMRIWIETAKNNGITDVSIWRLGGNSVSTLAAAQNAFRGE